ncbi:hypothetical protein MAIT1_03899 [Magnetofaba australis IT-1]|uniref:Uncharacterized protein n=1 Tax=Magnetofaba australis IT-1 TaxID=1434232 RepID=A0A1Y2K9K4_9PROT|nr:hypothetical protein MAIT1_03899 [Magnetofaba australis IT-1]
MRFRLFDYGVEDLLLLRGVGLIGHALFLPVCALLCTRRQQIDDASRSGRVSQNWRDVWEIGCWPRRKPMRLLK